SGSGGWRLVHVDETSALPVAVANTAPAIDAELPGIVVELELRTLGLGLELDLLLGLADEGLGRRVGPEHRELVGPGQARIHLHVDDQSREDRGVEVLRQRSRGDRADSGD